MTKDQVVAFIREERDRHAKAFREITEELKKKGYKAGRTSKPLSESTVRHIYHYGFKALEKRDKALVKDNIISFIQTILATKTLTDTQKIEMITVYLRQNEQKD